MNENEQFAALVRFARWAISESAFKGSDLDGGEIQDEAVQLGILEVVRATEPCGEECACVEFGFPQRCHRFADFMKAPQEEL